MFSFWKAFTRRKPIETDNTPSKLKRCLGTVDLTALGIGSTLGVGIYVITGTVAANQAGPSVVLSFLIAAVSSIFAGLCYAEFGALVPKAGSAYIYSYISVGELMAFVIGWNLILEYIIGTASVARSYSNYLDFLFQNKIQDFFSRYLKLPETKWFASYPDIFAFSLTILLAVMLMVGVEESTRFTTIFTGVNFLVIIYCIIVGLFKVNFDNWKITPDKLPEGKGGKGGFFPFGIKGMISGAATCFYSFVGFDAIATTGEEVLDPQKSLPIGIILSLLLVSFAYCGVSAVQTLMWPYWDQNQKAPLPYVFGEVGYPLAKNVITIGALAGLSTSLLGAMFPLPRILYAMSNDGLLFKFLGNISPRFKTPAIATMISGFLAALMATFFNVDELAEMMSIGTLLAYSLVAISILILRYKKEDNLNNSNVEILANHSIANSEEVLYEGSMIGRMFNVKSSTIPDQFSSRFSMFLILIQCVFIVALNIFLFFFEENLYELTIPLPATIALFVILGLMLLYLICLWRQPMVNSSASFKVPLVPFIPFLSVFSNTYLMVHLNELTWYRFIGWMIIGFIIYFTYGIVKSVGYLTQEEKDRLVISPVVDSQIECHSESIEEPSDLNRSNAS